MLKTLLVAFVTACSVPQPVTCQAIAEPIALVSKADASAQVSSDAANAVFRSQRYIVAMMSLQYNVMANVVWEPCGEENSYFRNEPGNPTIILCTEMAAHPGAAMMFAAHEMGHAVTIALADIADESAADEIAMISMARYGFLKEMLDGAIYYLSDGMPLDHRPGDTHPGNGYRAWEFACVAAGADGGPPECVELYHALTMKWDRRLLPRG